MRSGPVDPGARDETSDDDEVVRLSLSVLLAGGGTAGHVGPLLALADALTRRDENTRITVLGTAEGLEARLVPQAGYPLSLVPRVPLPRRPSADVLRLPTRLRAAVAAADRAITESGADVVVGFGGYVSTPAYLAARRRGVPIVVHEANARPGLANRLGARFAAAVACAVPGTPLPNAQVTGIPLRRAITTADLGELRSAALAEFGLAPDRTTLLVTGGSLGAQRLNAAFGQAAPQLRAAGVQVLHLSGRGKSVDLAEGPTSGQDDVPAYVVREYLDGMQSAFAVADLVVCRSGAGTVAEVTALGLPAVYVPLPIGNGEQRLNAEPVVAAGGGLLVADGDLTPQWISANLIGGEQHPGLLTDHTRLQAMGKAARAFGIRDGDEQLADLVIDVARRNA